jgi:hypothetical protein
VLVKANFICEATSVTVDLHRLHNRDKKNLEQSTMAANGTHQESLIRKTVKRLQQISKNTLSSQLREKATLAILDYFGAVASGLQAPWAPHLVKYASVRSGMNEAHVWGLQKDVSVETAAFVNAALAHT